MKTKLCYFIALLPVALLLVGATVVDKWGPFSYFQGDGGGLTNVPGSSIVGPVASATAATTATTATTALLANNIPGGIIASNVIFDLRNDQRVTFQGPNGGLGWQWVWFTDHPRLTNSAAFTWIDFNSSELAMGSGANTKAWSLSQSSGNAVFTGTATATGFIGSGAGLTGVALLAAATNTFTGRQIASGFSTAAANALNPFTVVTLPANVGGVAFFTNTAACSIYFTCKAGTGFSAALSTTNLWPTVQTIPVTASSIEMLAMPSGYILLLTNSSQPTLTVTWPIQ